MINDNATTITCERWGKGPNSSKFRVSTYQSDMLTYYLVLSTIIRRVVAGLLGSVS